MDIMTSHFQRLTSQDDSMDPYDRVHSESHTLVMADDDPAQPQLEPPTTTTAATTATNPTSPPLAQLTLFARTSFHSDATAASATTTAATTTTTTPTPPLPATAPDRLQAHYAFEDDEESSRDVDQGAFIIRSDARATPPAD